MLGKIKAVLKNKYFIMSFSISAIVIFVTAAVLTVDYNCRAVSFGDTTPLVEISRSQGSTYLEIDMLGINDKRDITAAAQIWGKFCDMICFPHS